MVDALFPADQEDRTGELRKAAMEVCDPSEDLGGQAGGVVSASDLRDRLHSSITQPELPVNADFVRVMSMHKAKGLTAELVIVLGCIEGLIPSLPDNATQAEEEAAVEEQRRLFYVAVTRPRQTLVLSSVRTLPTDMCHQMRARYGRSSARISYTVSSRFFSELGPSRPRPIRGDQFLAETGVTAAE